ncbi:olfactory receptor 5V1-like [Rhinoderma darwinii]|uniref:olfactory receptor 5V1-like n=1 Tax=Rhinoderma darwinii TaxID=43563 RepID=UPI003F67EF31
MSIDVFENANQTSVRTFIVLALSNVLGLRVIFSLLFTVIYAISILGNLLLIVVVTVNVKLQTPMYFFLCNLSLIDIGFCSTVVPKVLINTISQDTSISFLGCATQIYFHFALGSSECLILAVMSYDRYNAICKPLRYKTIMDKNFCLYLAAGCWTAGFINSMFLTIFTFQLPYCKSNRVNYFFCEMPPVVRLLCKDIWFAELVEYILVVVTAVGSFLLILTSYLCITLTILNIRSTQQKKKAFSTCASHLGVVSLYYGTVLFNHLRPRSSYSPNQDRVVSILYTVVTPMLNPIIYSVRNKDVKGALRKTIGIMGYH